MNVVDNNPEEAWYTPIHKLKEIGRQRQNDKKFHTPSKSQVEVSSASKRSTPAPVPATSESKKEADAIPLIWKTKPVEQLDLETGEVLRRYISGKDAADAMETTNHVISAACRGSSKRGVNFGWRFFVGDPAKCMYICLHS
jgi:hypothetical protein